MKEGITALDQGKRSAYRKRRARARLTIDSNRIKRSLAVGILSGQLNGLMMVTFGASLGGEGKGDGIAVGLAKNITDLIDGVGAIFKFGNVEAFFFDDIIADNFIDDDLFGYTFLNWNRYGRFNSHVQRYGN